jgi:PHD/YefM family antitoxin component YafN of YafNO toxin-antitoxin module
MPQIIPIKDLKNTSAVSELCHRVPEPVFITKNGYGDMVLMSMEAYERTIFLQEVYTKLEQAEHEIEEGRTLDARDSLRALREKYGV